MNDENTTETKAAGAPAPAAQPSAAARAAAETMKRGRGRPAGSKNKPAGNAPAATAAPEKKSGEEKPADPPPIPWDDARTEKALEQLGAIGEQLGVPEWKVSAEQRKFVAPYLTPYMARLVPNPGRANVVMTLIIFLGVFGNAVIATIERIQIVGYKIVEFILALRARVAGIFARRSAPTSTGDENKNAADPPPARRAEGEGHVLQPVARS